MYTYLVNIFLRLILVCTVFYSFEIEILSGINIGSKWVLVNDNAAWMARQHHTSLIDDDSNIYVIGGQYSGNGVDVYFNDVWKSSGIRCIIVSSILQVCVSIF